MKNQDLFTVGEITRQGLLLKYTGEPIKHVSQVSRIVKSLKGIELSTPHGMSKCLTREQIAKYNFKKCPTLVENPYKD